MPRTCESDTHIENDSVQDYPSRLRKNPFVLRMFWCPSAGQVRGVLLHCRMESPIPNLTGEVSWGQARTSNYQCRSKNDNSRLELSKSGFIVSPNGRESTPPGQTCLGESCTRDRNVNYTEPSVRRLRLNLLITQQRSGKSDSNISSALKDRTVHLPVRKPAHLGWVVSRTDSYSLVVFFGLVSGS